MFGFVGWTISPTNVPSWYTWIIFESSVQRSTVISSLDTENVSSLFTFSKTVSVISTASSNELISGTSLTTTLKRVKLSIGSNWEKPSFIFLNSFALWSWIFSKASYSRALYSPGLLFKSSAAASAASIQRSSDHVESSKSDCTSIRTKGQI
jgi:hypothetical protein